MSIFAPKAEVVLYPSGTFFSFPALMWGRGSCFGVRTSVLQEAEVCVAGSVEGCNETTIVRYWSLPDSIRRWRGCPHLLINEGLGSYSTELLLLLRILQLEETPSYKTQLHSAARRKGAIGGLGDGMKGLQWECPVIQPLYITASCYTALTNEQMGAQLTGFLQQNNIQSWHVP